MFDIVDSGYCAIGDKYAPLPWLRLIGNQIVEILDLSPNLVDKVNYMQLIRLITMSLIKIDNLFNVRQKGNGWICKVMVNPLLVDTSSQSGLWIMEESWKLLSKDKLEIRPKPFNLNLVYQVGLWIPWSLRFSPSWRTWTKGFHR